MGECPERHPGKGFEQGEVREVGRRMELRPISSRPLRIEKKNRDYRILGRKKSDWKGGVGNTRKKTPRRCSLLSRLGLYFGKGRRTVKEKKEY